MSHHVIRICIEGQALNGARATHSTLVIVPTSTYQAGLHHGDAFEHARAAGLEPPYRVVHEYEVAACTPAHPRRRGPSGAHAVDEGERSLTAKNEARAEFRGAQEAR